MPLKLFIDPLSQPSRAVLAYLVCSKIPHEVIQVSVITGEQRSKEFKKKNPLAKVPVIDDDGFILQESHAIIAYLSAKYIKLDPLYPSDIKTKAQIDSYLHWHHLGTRRCAAYFRSANPHLFPNEKLDKEFEGKTLHKILVQFEAIFLKDSKYLCGQNSITVADFVAVPEIMQLHLSDFDFSKLPKIAEYLERCMQDPSLKEAHAVFYKFLAKMKPKPNL
jgi:glutathione S-transferase